MSKSKISWPKFPAALAFVFALLLFFVFIDTAVNPQNLLFTEEIKHSKLERTLSPKVVLVGGSNLSFGIDSKYLEHELHVPVVNMGITGALGLKYMLEEVEPFLHKGDVCVIVPEYEHFYCDPDHVPATLVTLSKAYPRSLTFMDLEHRLNVAHGYVDLCRQRCLQFIKNQSQTQSFDSAQMRVYSKDSFNSDGDMMGHVGISNPKWAHIKIMDSCGTKFNRSTLDLVTTFSKSEGVKGITCVVAFPFVPQEQYALHKPLLDFVHSTLRVSGMETLGIPATSTYPTEYFFDSGYHLKSSVRTQRCKTLCDQLTSCPSVNKRLISARDQHTLRL